MGEDDRLNDQRSIGRLFCSEDSAGVRRDVGELHHTDGRYTVSRYIKSALRDSSVREDTRSGRRTRGIGGQTEPKSGESGEIKGFGPAAGGISSATRDHRKTKGPERTVGPAVS